MEYNISNKVMVTYFHMQLYSKIVRVDVLILKQDMEEENNPAIDVNNQ